MSAVAASPSTSLVVLPHPLTLEGRSMTQGAELRPGDTLVEFLSRAGVDTARGDWTVTIGGAAVPAMMWGRTRPRHGQVIEVRRRAQKNALRLVAMIALAYVTFGASTTIGVAMGFEAGGFAAFAINSAVYIAGTVLINKLLPPTRAHFGAYDNATGQTYSLAGGRNRMRPYEPLGLLFGTTKVVPDFAAQPYTWFESEDQFQYVRLHAGINAGSVASLKIGTTDIASFTDVVVKQSGFPGTTTKLEDWANVDTIAGGTLDAPTAPGAYVTRTSSANSVRLAIDIGAQLYDMADDGGFNTATVNVEAELRLLPGGAWTPFGIFGTAGFDITSKSAKPVRMTLVTAPLAVGQYEVRMRKMTANVSTSRAANVVEWGSLKSYQEDNTDYSSHPQVGIRIKATGQINGVLDEVSWVGTSADVPVWNGSAWVTAPTRNPGAHILRFARGIYDGAGRLMAGLGLPDDQIDIETLKTFMVHCTTKGYVFDHFFDGPVSCLDLMEAMANSALGSISYHPGTLSVVWADEGQPIEAVVAMGNIRQGTFRVDYATRSSAEEVEVTYFDRDNGYLPASVRVLAPGVTVPRDTARLAPVGTTTQAGALRNGRFAMAQNVYQRKTVAWDMDLEHMTFRRYSIVALSHDLTQWGYGGRLKAAVDVAGTVTITLDDEVPWNGAAATRKVGLRIPGERGYRLFSVATFAGTTRTLTLVGAWPGGVPFPGDSAGNPAHDTLWIYDFKAEPGARLRVTNIEPANGLGGARITAVPEPDEFWTFMSSGSYTVPPSASSLPPVVASNLKVAQRRLDVNYTNGTELSLTWDVSGPWDHAQVWGAPAGEELKLLGTTLTNSWPSIIVGNDGVYDIEVRPFDQLGRQGTEVSAAHSVTLASTLTGAARTLKLVASSQVFQVPKTGPATPGSITFTAVMQNLAGSPSFSVSSGTATLTGTGTARSLAYSDLTTDAATIQVSWDGLTDTVTVVKVREGADAYAWLLTNEAAVVAADASGTVASWTPGNGEMQVWQGSTRLTSGVTYSIVSPTNVTMSINSSTGIYSVTAMSADAGYATVRATVSGGPVLDRLFSIAKSRAGTNGSNGSNGTNGTNGTDAVSSQFNPGQYAYTFTANSDGVIDAGQTPAVTLKVYIGATDDSANWSFSRASSDASITTTISTNTVTVTGFGSGIDTGYVDVTATRGGYPTQVQRLNLAKTKRAVPDAHIVAPGPNPISTTSTTTPATCTSGIRFKTDGTVQRKASGSSSTYNSTSMNWFVNGTPGTYYINMRERAGARVDGVGAATTDGTLTLPSGSLASDKTVTLAVTAGQYVDTLVDWWISTDSGGEIVVSSGTVSFHAEST